MNADTTLYRCEHGTYPAGTCPTCHAPARRRPTVTNFSLRAEIMTHLKIVSVRWGRVTVEFPDGDRKTLRKGEDLEFFLRVGSNQGR